MAHGADVVRHVFADFAVAACGRLHQQAVFVTQVDRQAVEFQLGHVVERAAFDHSERVRPQGGALAFLGALVFGGQVAAHLLLELFRACRRHVGFGANRQHRHGVAHRRESGQHRAADTLRGRIGRLQFGVRGL